MAQLLDDEYLKPYETAIRGRAQRAADRMAELTGGKQSLSDWANAHNYYGLRKVKVEGEGEQWCFREWAPHATSMWLVGDFNGWKINPDFEVFRIEGTDVWERRIPADKIRHGDHYHLEMRWEGGHGERIPAYARYVTQDEKTKLFSACVWDPEREYEWRIRRLFFLREAERIPLLHSSTRPMSACRRKIRASRRTRSSATTCCRGSRRRATIPCS